MQGGVGRSGRHCTNRYQVNKCVITGGLASQYKTKVVTLNPTVRLDTVRFTHTLSLW